MKKTTNLIIIDASGSMESKKEAVISGLKELLAQIKIDAKNDEASVETSTIVVDFSGANDFNVLINAGNSALLDDDVSGNYKTRGNTALYDAIGRGFNMVPEGENNVFVSILTDGQENASREYTHKSIKSLIEAKKALGWVITFQGTTDEAINNAQSWGITGGNTMSFTDSLKGVKMSSSKMSNARSMYYTNTMSNMDEKERGATIDTSWTVDLLAEASKKVEEDEKLKKSEKKEEENKKKD